MPDTHEQQFHAHVTAIDHEVYDTGEDEVVEWWAYCTCGWQGPMRDGFEIAGRDAEAHRGK